MLRVSFVSSKKTLQHMGGSRLEGASTAMET